MQNVIDKIEWMFAGLGGFLGWFFGGFDLQFESATVSQLYYNYAPVPMQITRT